MNQIEELLKRVLTSLLVDMVISGARGGGDFIKIKVRPVMIRDSLYFQVSRYTDKQVFHENMTAEDALETLSGWILHDFRQAQIRMQDEMVTVLVSKKGKATIKSKKAACIETQNLEHNRKKQYIIEEGKKTGINVLPAACVSVGMKGQELTDMDALKAAGAVGFTDDGIPLMNEKLVYEAMKKAKELNVPLSFHEEDPAFISENGINAGAVAKELGITGSPALAEDSLVARDCMIALHTGASVNIQHISSATSVKAVKLAKELGANVTAEVTPHHFTLDETAVLEHGAMAKMNPPLRTAKDREGIIEGIKDGSIDMIATDHAPHSAEEKAVLPVWKAPSGIIGLETALGLAVTELVKKGHLTTMQLVEKMCVNPAKLYHFDKGYLAEGKDADIVIFNENEEWTVTDAEIASKSHNTPFIGTKLFGRVKYTICGGKIVYKD